MTSDIREYEKHRLEMNEILREWDVDSIERAEDKGWLSSEEAKTMKALIHKIWDGRRKDISDDAYDDTRWHGERPSP